MEEKWDRTKIKYEIIQSELWGLVYKYDKKRKLAEHYGLTRIKEEYDEVIDLIFDIDEWVDDRKTRWD